MEASMERDLVPDVVDLVRELRRQHPEGYRHVVHIEASLHEDAPPEHRFAVAWFTLPDHVQFSGTGATFEAALADAKACECRVCGKPCGGSAHEACGALIFTPAVDPHAGETR